MAKYNGSVELISGIKPKNNGVFPLVNAHDVQVDDEGTRLDEKLDELSKYGSGVHIVGAVLEKVTDDTPNLIYFTIDGTTYQAVEGTNWDDWDDSDYEPDDDVVFISGTMVMVADNTPLLLDGAFVYATDPILKGAAYKRQEPIDPTNLANPNDPNWLLNKRYSSSLEERDVDASIGAVVTNVIDVRNVQDHVKIYNLNIKDMDSTGTFNGRIYGCDESGTVTFESGGLSGTPQVTFSDNISTISKSYLTTNNLQYIRLGGWLTNGAGTSGDVIIRIDEEDVDVPTLITFTIDGITQRAESGMAWGEWVESTYNDYGCEIAGTTVIVAENTPLQLDGVNVNTFDPILEWASYVRVTSGNEPIDPTNLAKPSDPNWLLNKRYDSSFVERDVDTNIGAVVTNVIDVRNLTKYIKIYNLNIKDNDSTGTFNGRVYICNIDGTVLSSPGTMTNNTGVTFANGVSTINKTFFNNLSGNTGFIRLGGWLTNGAGTSNQVVIRIDEET